MGGAEMEKLIRMLIGLIWGMAVCAMIAMLFGCSTLRTIEVPVEVERVQHDTTRSVAWRSDTLIIKDTVRLVRDTVYHSVWRDRIRVVRDTLITVRVDTIPRVLTVTKEVTKYRSPWYAKIAYLIAGVSIMVVVAMVMRKKLL